MLAAGLAAVAVVGTAMMAVRFHRAKRSWRPLPPVAALSARPERPALFPDVPRYPKAIATPWPASSPAPAPRGATRRTAAEHYAVAEDVERVAAWYRSQLDHRWQEVGPARDRLGRTRFERREPDGGTISLTVSPGYYDKEGKTPILNMTGILMERFAPPR